MADYTVLVVDYEPRTAEVVAMVTGESGLKVETAKDGIAAIAAFKKLRPVLTLIEFMLPRKPGLEVCRELRQSAEGKDANLVVMSSRFRGRQYRADALRIYGANDFVEKPLDRDKIAALVERFIKPRLAEMEGAAAAVVPFEQAAPVVEPAAKPAGMSQAKATPRPAPAVPAHPAEVTLDDEIEDHVDSILDF